MGGFTDAEFCLCDTCEKVYVLSAQPHICEHGPGLTDHGGAFNTFLKRYYFPFLLRFSRTGPVIPATKRTPPIVVSWLGIFWIILFGICCGFGPGFLSNTRSGLDVPAGTPTADALDVLNSNYPEASSWPPAIVLHHVKPGFPGTIITNSTQRVAEVLDQFQIKYNDVISGVNGYFEFMALDLPILAETTVSKDRRSMISTVTMRKGAELKDVTDMVKELLEVVHHLSYHDIDVGLTGIFPLFGEMQEATESNFAMIDGIALPVCIIILGLNLRSYKHMAVALANLGVTLMLSFAIILPISNAVDINPFSPSIMMSLGIAVCFDYSLFMLNRFREAVILEGFGTEDAVLSALQSAGHVVVLSGTTLLATFLLLLIFPQNFLQSVGWACSSVVLSAIVVNMSVTPLLLLYFKCLTSFEALPPCLTRRQPNNSCCKRSPKSEKRSIPLEDVVPEPASHSSTTSAETNSVPTATTNTTTASAAPVRRVRVEEPNQKPGRSCWFRISYAVTKHPWIALFLALAATAGFAERWLAMIVTSDDTILFLQGSHTLDTLGKMRENFDEGMLDPFSMVITTKSGAENSVLTQEYFTEENALLNSIVATQSRYVAPKSFTALSMFAARNVTFMEALGYLSEGSPVYNSTTAASYRLSVGSLMNKRRSASLVRISTIVHPKSQEIVPFIDGVRAKLKSLDGILVVHLFGAYSSDYDVQNALYEITPFLYASTILILLLIVGASFQSVMISLRLAITIIMSLAWTYGLMTMVYQPGPAQTAFAVIGPSLIKSTGVYWIIPIMSFSILVGLALDYDIFLMSRVVEFRRYGWSDRAAICLAIEKTGGIITAAGVIMAVSFAGLLFPNTMALNQYGFSLCIGVTLDTFVVRTVLVPAVFTAFGRGEQTNWWPGSMPRQILSDEDERAALMAGYWKPPEKWPVA